MEKAISKNESCCSSSKIGKAKPRASNGKADETPHPDHSSQVARLNRVIGQLEGVKRMIAARRYCPEILTQTRAIASALKAIEMGILEKHIRHCVSEALSAQHPRQTDRKVEELILVLDRF